MREMRIWPPNAVKMLVNFFLTKGLSNPTIVLNKALVEVIEA